MNEQKFSLYFMGLDERHQLLEDFQLKMSIQNHQLRGCWGFEDFYYMRYHHIQFLMNQPKIIQLHLSRLFFLYSCMMPFMSALNVQMASKNEGSLSPILTKSMLASTICNNQATQVSISTVNLNPSLLLEESTNSMQSKSEMEKLKKKCSSQVHRYRATIIKHRAGCSKLNSCI